MIYGAGEVAPRLMGFLLLPIYTRYLSPADYGIISYTTSISLFVFVVGTLSLNTFVLRHYFELNTEEAKAKLLGNIFLFLCFFSLFCTLISLLIFPLGIKAFNVQVPFWPYFVLALLTNFLDSLSILPLVYYRLQRNALGYVRLTFVRAVLAYALTFTFIVLLRWGVLGHYYGNLLTGVCYAVVYSIVMFRHAKLRIDWKQIGSGLKFSAPLVPGALAYIILTSSDRIIMERYLPLSDIGIYNIAVTLTLALAMISLSVYKAVEPEIFRNYGRKEFVAFFYVVKGRYLSVLFIAAMGLALFSQEALMIMASEKFLEGYKLVPIRIVGLIFSGVNILYGCLIVAAKRTKILGVSVVLGATVSVLFNVAFIPLYGVYAAASAFGVSYAVMTLFLYYYLPKKMKSFRKEAVLLVFFVVIFYFVLFYFDIQVGFIGVILKSLAYVLFSASVVFFYRTELNVKKVSGLCFQQVLALKGRI